MAMQRIQSHLKLLTCVGFLCFGPIGAAVGAGWFDFFFGWKLNWRLLVDLMVHKEFDSQYNGSSASDLEVASNGTKGLSLLDLVLRLNGVQENREA